MHSNSYKQKAKFGISIASMIALNSFVLCNEVFANDVAGDTAAAQNNGDSAEESDEILVTARRREESVERVPISITAFSPRELNERAISTQSDLQYSTPGLTVVQGSNVNELTYAIRGQTVDPYSESSPGVLGYINDVQINTAGAGSIYDLESLQVLKGPQGTLFGRNTTGGAVLFNTAKPGETFGGNAEVKIGAYGLREISGAVDIPLVSEQVLLRVAGDTIRRGGYITNLYNNSRVGKVKRDSIRGSLTLRPTEGLENRTVVQYEKGGGDNGGMRVYSVYGPDGQTVYSLAHPNGYQPNQGPLTGAVGTYFSPAIDVAFNFPGAFALYAGAHPKVDPLGIIHYVGVQAANGPYTINADSPNSHRSKDVFVTNTTTLSLNADTSIKNIFGFADSKTVDLYDLDGTPYTIYTFVLPTRQGYNYDRRQISEEFQVSGKIGSGVDYVAGVYYARERKSVFSNFGAFELAPLSGASFTPRYYTSIDTQLAGYLQAGFDMGALAGLNGVKLNAGFRWTHDKAKLSQFSGGGGGALNGVNFGAAPESRADSNASWLVGIDYQASPDLMLYFTQRGSWRTGGISGQAPAVPKTFVGGGNFYLPEKTYDFEIGAKYRGRLGSVPVRLNLAAYDQTVTDVQRVVYFTLNGALTGVTLNIPKARITGFEAGGSIEPSDWLELGGSLAYAHARYVNGNVNYPSLGISVSYGPYGATPKLTSTAYLRAHADLGDIGAAVFRADLYRQTSFNFSQLGNTTNPGTVIPGYTLVNLRAELNDIKGTGFSAAVYLRNLFDKAYYTGGLATGSSAGINMANIGEPRMGGVELKFKF